MIQRASIDLRQFHLDSDKYGELTLRPSAEFYTRRLLVIVSLWIITVTLWVFNIEMPWQWEARREREELKQRTKLEANQQLLNAFRELRSLPGVDESLLARKLPTSTDEAAANPRLLNASAEQLQWQLQVPGWLQLMTATSVLVGLYWFIGACCSSVHLSRSKDDGIWIRYWSLWPRKLFVGQAAATRLIPRLMQVLLFGRQSQRIIGVKWCWMLQLTSDWVADIPQKPNRYVLGWRSFLPSLWVADQPDEPLPGQSPPSAMQEWIQIISQQLGLQVEPLRRAVHQLGISPNGGKGWVMQEASTIQIPLSSTVQSYDIQQMDPAELRTLLDIASRNLQASSEFDGQIEIPIHQTTRSVDIAPDEMKSLMSALPPELRKLIANTKRQL